MDHHAGALIVDQRGVFGNAVIAFHLEAIPVGPDCRTDIVLLEQIGDLVAFHRMMERADAVSHLLGHIDHQRSEEHTSELQSLMRTSYAVFCLKQKISSHNSHP